MSFAAPLLLLGLGLLLPVLIAFLVRRRRRVERVPSVMLWRLAAVTRSRSRRIQNLTRLLALLACLAAVAALVVAAARPSPRSQGETVAIVIDVSASMSADGGRPTLGGGGAPLAEARRIVDRMLASRSTADRYLLIAAGPTPRRLAGPTDAAPVLAEGAARIQVERGAADLQAALELASSLVAGSVSPRIVLLTDGGESTGDRRADLRGVPLTERRLAPPTRDNLGVVAFAARAPADAADDAEREALVTVATSSDRPRSARVTLYADGHAVAERRVDLPARGEAEARLRMRVAATSLTVKVAPADGATDAIGIDDEASVQADVRPPLRALLVLAAGDASAGGFFAEKALLAAGIPAVVRLTPDAVAAEARTGDLVVAIEHGPTRRPDVPVLYLGTRDGALPVSGLRELTTPAETRLLSVDGSDALLRGVVLDGLTVSKAHAATVPADGRALVELDGGAAMIAGGTGRAAWIYVGIEPEGSDLVLRVAFPVLVANAVTRLAGAADVAIAETAPRAEVALRPTDEPPAPAEPEAPWRMPFPPAALLGALAAVLLSMELAAYRKGWAV